MTMASHSAGEIKVSGWAIGLEFMTAGLMITTGSIAMIYGLSEALFNALGAPSETIIHIGVRGWGVIHFLVGAGLFTAGLNIFAAKYWARMVGIAVSAIVLLAGIASFESGPVFAVFLVVLNLAVLWALVFHWRDLEEVSD